ncbi:hypothetical protein MN608_08414 [Microdochium nivale]|nr:hypothetical protein MN608_08414 [Microdochium nivale]
MLIQHRPGVGMFRACLWGKAPNLTRTQTNTLAEQAAHRCAKPNATAMTAAQTWQAQPSPEPCTAPPQHGAVHAELHIDCLLNGIAVVACADTGANFDAISPAEVIRRQLTAVPSRQGRPFRLPTGEARRTLGSVDINLGFGVEEEAEHRIRCEIVANLAHPMVLSFPTLTASGVLQQHRWRLRKVLVSSLQHPALQFLEAAHQSTNRARGFVDEVPILAVPDTGSSLMCISGDFAREFLPSNRIDATQRQAVRFADGSSAMTLGTMRAAWQFDPQEAPIECLWHVITGLQAQAILSLDFVQEHEIFSSHSDSLVCKEADTVSPPPRSSSSTTHELFGIYALPQRSLPQRSLPQASLPQEPKTPPHMAKRCCDALLRIAKRHNDRLRTRARGFWRQDTSQRQKPPTTTS